MRWVRGLGCLAAGMTLAAFAGADNTMWHMAITLPCALWVGRAIGLYAKGDQW